MRRDLTGGLGIELICTNTPQAKSRVERANGVLQDRLVKELRAHRKTQVNHPWTNGQVERMNRTLKEATIQNYYYKSHKELREHMVYF